MSPGEEFDGYRYVYVGASSLARIKIKILAPHIVSSVAAYYSATQMSLTIEVKQPLDIELKRKVLTRFLCPVRCIPLANLLLALLLIKRTIW